MPVMEIEEVARGKTGSYVQRRINARHPGNLGQRKRMDLVLADLIDEGDAKTAKVMLMRAVEEATRWTKVDAKEWREVADWDVRARYAVKVLEWVIGKPRESVDITTSKAEATDSAAMSTADMLLRIAAQPELASRILDTMAERARQVAPSPGSPRSSPKASESTPVSPASPTSPDSTSNHAPNAPESGPT